MTSKQQQLTFDKGITTVPSDAICSDNALSECVGLVYENGEHRVIQNPKQFMTGLGTKTLLYVHKFNNSERYIINDGTYLKWGTNVSGTYTPAQSSDSDVVLLTLSGTPKITSIGKTLIVSDGNGFHYFLWKENSYTDIGQIPEPKVELWLSNTIDITGRWGGSRAGAYVSCRLSCDGYFENVGQNTVKIADGKQSDYNNLVIGMYSKNKKSISRTKGFCEPFLIRTALKMYDGTYTYISQPIMMFPSVTKNSHFGITGDDISCSTYFCRLYYKNKSNYENWEDVIKEVSIFISDGINIYDTSSDQDISYFSANDTVVADGLYYFPSVNTDPINANFSTWKEKKANNGYFCLKRRDFNEICSDITSTSVFYKLCDIGLGDQNDNSIKKMADQFNSYILENITTQEQLEYDDYYSRCKIKSNFLYAYNSRLNVGNVSRGFFEGFDSFLPNDNSTPNTYDFYVTIKSEDGNRIVHHQKETPQKQGIYFYYPDSRASNVTIIKNTNTVLLNNVALKEHTGLNGAYYFYPLTLNTYSESDLDNYFDEPTGATRTEDPPSANNNATELLPNYILQSEVNNPFVFKAEGYFKVGTGKILGMSSITQALSEGQFGQYPLLVFSDEGIWALSVGTTGYYTSIHPMSREVCNSAKSITQTDGAVFFASKKGLMVIVGSNVKCVSEQLSGKTNAFSYNDTSLVADLGHFNTFLEKAFIAYDYRDSLLWIFDGATHSLTTGSNHCWVYGIKSGTFSKYNFGSNNNTPIIVTNVVNNYPDYLLQTGTNVLSLTGRDDINTEAEAVTPVTYSGTILSRPMKLENGLALKSIMQVHHIKSLSSGASLSMRIFASNNLVSWVELKSLRGMPFKYYRFLYSFTGLKAVDRFAGTILITQERRNDKLR